MFVILMVMFGCSWWNAAVNCGKNASSPSKIQRLSVCGSSAEACDCGVVLPLEQALARSPTTTATLNVWLIRSFIPKPPLRSRGDPVAGFRIEEMKRLRVDDELHAVAFV